MGCGMWRCPPYIANDMLLAFKRGDVHVVQAYCNRYGVVVRPSGAATCFCLLVVCVLEYYTLLVCQRTMECGEGMLIPCRVCMQQLSALPLCQICV